MRSHVGRPGPYHSHKSPSLPRVLSSCQPQGPTVRRPQGEARRKRSGGLPGLFCSHHTLLRWPWAWGPSNQPPRTTLGTRRLIKSLPPEGPPARQHPVMLTSGSGLLSCGRISFCPLKPLSFGGFVTAASGNEYRAEKMHSANKPRKTL